MTWTKTKKATFKKKMLMAKLKAIVEEIKTESADREARKINSNYRNYFTLSKAMR